MDTNTDHPILDWIFDSLDHHQKPIMFRKVCKYVLAKKPGVTAGSVRSILHELVKRGIIIRLKFPKRYSFYCRPDWVEDGKVKQELNFDPYYNKQIK
jgi:hypothetical protein